MQFSMDVKVTKKQFEDMPKKIQERILPRALKELSNIIYYDMRARAPVRTGELRNSIVQKEKKMSVEVGPTAKHTPFVILGTRPHLIRPVVAQALHWVDAEGDDVFARSVFHPGTRPNNFIQIVADQVNPQIVPIFENVFQEEMDRVE